MMYHNMINNDDDDYHHDDTIYCSSSFSIIAQSWGVLLYEHLHVLNILTKGSLRDTLSKRENRLVLALMIRESYKVICGGC